MWEWPAAFRTDTDIPGWPGNREPKDRQAEGVLGWKNPLVKLDREIRLISQDSIVTDRFENWEGRREGKAEF